MPAFSARHAPDRVGPSENGEDWTAGLIDAAVGRLREDGFVAYPTETVWGLGACADRPAAIDRLLQWKGRGSDAPLAVLVPKGAMGDHVARLGCRIEAPAQRLIEAFWPGPLMLVLSCDRRWAPGVARADGALGVRCSSNSVSNRLATALANAGLGPLTSTSFNRTGDPPAATRKAAAALISGGSASIADPLFVDFRGEDAGGERPSTVVDCTGDDPTSAGFVVLREGAISADEVAAVISG
jgi:L-threonylcarbamoyladenylate synthase